MVMHWIIHEWIARLMLLRERLREHFAAGSAAGGGEADAWYLMIRARILAFLVRRYRELPIESEERTQGSPGHEGAEIPSMPTFCSVLPEDAPPRKREDLGRLLRSIRARNEASRPRWRWWI